MLVKRDQRAQGIGGDLLDQERVAGTVSFKDFKRKQPLDLSGGLSRPFQLLPRLFGGFSVHQRLALGEKVGKQFLVVVSGRIVAADRRDKVAGDQPGSLVNELEKRMLTVGAGLSPDYRPGLISHRIPIPSGLFPVAFHIALLKIRREAVQVLIVRENGLGMCIAKVGIP